MSDEIRENVRKYGWSAISVDDHNPPFVYSIGLLQNYSHPELIIFGLNSSEAHSVLSALVRDVSSGRPLENRTSYTISVDGEGKRVGFRSVHATQHQVYLGFAMEFARESEPPEELKALQVFWPDRDGKFPFDPGCDLFVYGQQPRLDVALTKREISHFKRQYE